MIFERVIAAIDGTRAGFEAGRQAARLLRPGGELLLVAVADPALAIFQPLGTRAARAPRGARGGGAGGRHRAPRGPRRGVARDDARTARRCGAPP